MGIGTSLGAFYQDEFHQTMDNYMKNPNSTPDNNELSTNEVMPDPEAETKITPIDYKTVSPLVTITDADIEKGMGMALSFSGSGIRKGPQMRNPANDNPKPGKLEPRTYPLPSSEYNPPGTSYQDIMTRFDRGNEIIDQRGKLMDIMKDRPLNDIEKQKLKNLDKQHEEHFGGYSLD